MERIILFDGECNFCDSSVQFIIKRDPNGVFSFASLQGEIGKKLLHDHGLKNNMETIVLLEGEHVYIKSSAALRICRHLNGYYKYLSVLRVVPAPIRDIFYNQVAKNRYKWFGRKESCLIPSPEVRSRFLDEK